MDSQQNCPSRDGARGFLAPILAAIALSAVAAAPAPTAWQPLPLSLAGEAAAFGGLTTMTGRSILPRPAYTAGGILTLGDDKWAWLSFGIDGLTVEPSSPDAALFLYRGYAGNSVFLETGPRLSLAGFGWKPLAKSRMELLGGAGMAATEDTGTTLVSIVPFLRFDARLAIPLLPWLAASVGMPIEIQKHGASVTTLAGLSLGLAVIPLSPVKR